jgi:hypothetical protein
MAGSPQVHHDGFAAQLRQRDLATPKQLQGEIGRREALARAGRLLARIGSRRREARQKRPATPQGQGDDHQDGPSALILEKGNPYHDSTIIVFQEDVG